jgi:hypothetical protein
MFVDGENDHKLDEIIIETKSVNKKGIFQDNGIKNDTWISYHKYWENRSVWVGDGKRWEVRRES